ncbi:MAG: ketoacyl-ACP synthase III [Bacteroidetes bacterium]|nr:ketoacyl-ACP synthase III [Bacteroidota bacterium]
MLYLHGIGHFFPENIITNDFLSSLNIGVDINWIIERVGIEERRTVLPLDYIRSTKNKDVRAAVEAAQYGNAEMGKQAALMAIERAGIQKQEIGMVISSSCVPDRSTPAEAATIAAALEIECMAIDINTACSSFGVVNNLLDNLNNSFMPLYVLIVNVESMTKVVDYTDRSSAVLWGDGCSASIISSRVKSNVRLSRFGSWSSPSQCEKVRAPRVGYFSQDGNAVQNFAIKNTVGMIKELSQDKAYKTGDFHFIGHQANYKVLTSVCQRCEISAENHWHNVILKGNTGSAGAPSVLSMNFEKLKIGTNIILAVLGAGLTWSSMLIEVKAQAD